MSTDLKSKEEFAPSLEEFFDEPVERYALPNGLIVLLKEDHSSKLASTQVWVKAGSICEGGNLGAGLSHFLEHMLFKGTAKRPGSQISRDVQGAGGYLNAYTTFDRTVYYIDLPSESIDLALDVLGDAVFNALLPADEVEREREVILREIDMGQDDPDRRVTQALFGNAFRLHPYRNPVIGHREVFESLQRGDLVSYYKAQYIPNNTVLVVVGDFDVDTVREAVDRNFGKYSRVALPIPISVEEPQQLALREEHLFGDVNVCRGGLAFKICGIAHPDAPALDVLATVLGGGNSSVLWRRLREERKIVHYVDAATWSLGNSGLLWISYLCDTDKREIVQNAILEEIERNRADGYTDRQIEKARRQALVSEIDLRKTMSGQASRLGLAEVVIGDLGYPKNYFSRIETVSTEQLMDLSSSYLRKERLTAVSLNSPSPTTNDKSKQGREDSGFSDFETVELPNGVRIVWQQSRRLPKVHLRTVLRGGALYEPPAQRGVTGVLATLLTKDTEKWDASEIAEAVERLGGVFGEFVGNNTFGISLEVMSRDVEFAIELLGESMFNPNFKGETFERERTAQIASLKEELDEILDFGKRHLRELFFGDHPFSVDSHGTVEALEGLTKEEVREYCGKLVKGANLVLGVSGDFEEELIPKLGELFGGMTDDAFAQVSVPFNGPPRSGEFERNLDREQAVVFQAYPDVGIVDSRYHIGELLVELFSEMSGRLFLRVREELGLAYFVGASRMSGVESGMFYFCAGTHPGSHRQVEAEFDDEISRARRGDISEDELERCQRRLKAQKRMGLQSIGSCAMQAALNATYGLPVNDWKNYDERIDSITTDDLRQFATEMFNPDRVVKLVVKP